MINESYYICIMSRNYKFLNPEGSYYDGCTIVEYSSARDYSGERQLLNLSNEP